MSMFTYGGMEFDVHVIDLKRKFSVTDTESSGRLQSGGMHRDIIGTYYNYTLTVEPRDTDKSRADYDVLYEMLSAPVESRQLVVPYAQSVLRFDAYITSGEDSLNVQNGKNRWSGLSINFIAMAPQREG